MRSFLNAYNLDLKKVAILENAYDIKETKTINGLYSLTFKIPDNDPKVDFCNMFWFVRYGDSGDFYRIMSSTHNIDETGAFEFTCEHAIGTLIDDLMWNVIEYTNIQSKTVLNDILNKQTKKRWVLGTCDFNASYSYLWTDENLLNALFSVPKPWTSPYIWTYDFSSYPWKINLKAININKAPDYYIRAKKNLLSANERVTNADLCTRLYPLGYGEGVNQLNITSVNTGELPYIQAPASIIAKYGLISRMFVDRSIEDPKLLLDRAKATLAELQEPTYERTFNVIDLFPITNDPIDNADVGKVVKLTEDNTITYVTETSKTLDDPGDLTIKLSTKSTDVANTIAELADRQRIESTYAQGSTQLYSQSISENATKEKGAKLSFYIPSEMRHVNAVKMKVSLKRFRAFNKTTRGGGKSTNTSTEGGASTQTSSDGGGSTETSGSSGGATLSTTAKGGFNKTSGPSSRRTTLNGAGVPNSTEFNEYSDVITLGPETVYGLDSIMTDRPDMSLNNYSSHRHRIRVSHGHKGQLSRHAHRIKWQYHSHDMDHTHTYDAPDHQHEVTTAAHSHTVTIPTHRHTVKIPSHKHNVTIPDHKHEIEQGIFEYGSPTNAEVYIEGTKKFNMEKNGEFDITAHIAKDGKIPRGQWIDIEIKPNDIAYVSIHLYVQGFIQSRGDGNY